MGVRSTMSLVLDAILTHINLHRTTIIIIVAIQILTRALVKEKNIPLDTAENIVHDVLNVFMLTGFTNDTKQYFMKSSPVRPGDYLEFFAETNLLGVLSACPGGDCGSEHSSDVAKCYPLKVSMWDVDQKYLDGISYSKTSSYNRNHGIK